MWRVDKKKINAKWKAVDRSPSIKKLLQCRDAFNKIDGRKNKDLTESSMSGRGYVIAMCSGCHVKSPVRAYDIRIGRCCKPCSDYKRGRISDDVERAVISKLMSAEKRCCNKKEQRFPDYGGRGIKISNRYNPKKQRYPVLAAHNLMNDIGEPLPKQQLDRIDNDKGYVKGNLRWVSAKVNSRNKRNNVGGPSSGFIDKCESSGLNPKTVAARMRNNPDLTEEEAFNAEHFQRKSILKTDKLIIDEIESGRLYVTKNGVVYRIEGNQVTLLTVMMKGKECGGRQYCTVKVKNIECRVHRIVCLQYLGGQSKDQFLVDHISGNVHNNRLVNLQWASSVENASCRGSKSPPFHDRIIFNRSPLSLNRINYLKNKKYSRNSFIGGLKVGLSKIEVDKLTKEWGFSDFYHSMSDDLKNMYHAVVSVPDNVRFSEKKGPCVVLNAGEMVNFEEFFSESWNKYIRRTLWVAAYGSDLAELIDHPAIADEISRLPSVILNRRRIINRNVGPFSEFKNGGHAAIDGKAGFRSSLVLAAPELAVRLSDDSLKSPLYVMMGSHLKISVLCSACGERRCSYQPVKELLRDVDVSGNLVNGQCFACLAIKARKNGTQSSR